MTILKLVFYGEMKGKQTVIILFKNSLFAYHYSFRIAQFLRENVVCLKFSSHIGKLVSKPKPKPKPKQLLLRSNHCQSAPLNALDAKK